MTALIIITLLSISAFVALWIACRMAAKAYPCAKCDREFCEGCEYWNKMTGGNGDATI